MRTCNIKVSKSDNADEYAVRKRITAYFGFLSTTNFSAKENRELYIDLLLTLRKYIFHTKSAIREDLQELDICYANGAYKAAIILSGSILEAFMLDWLSDIDGKDYFRNPYRKVVKGTDGTEKWKICDTLCGYIDAIEEIERPDWMEESKKAHFIRENRNSVHAKVCLKKDLKLTRETCDKIITYLKDIIQTRFQKQEEEYAKTCAKTPWL